jgi:hypothetical protein
MARTQPSESEIQAAICEYLTFRRRFFVRLNNIAAPYRDTKGELRFRKMGKYARPGLADILVVKDGRAIFLEVKREGGKHSPEQVNFGSDAIVAGARYHLVRSVAEVLTIGL